MILKFSITAAARISAPSNHYGETYDSWHTLKSPRLLDVIQMGHSVDSVASYSSQNHVDRIRTQNFSAASCHEDGDFGSIKTSLFRRSSSNLEFPLKRPESVTSNASSTRSRLRELVDRKSSQDEHKSAANPVGDIQYFENPTETLEFDRPRISQEAKKCTDERPKKRKLAKSKEKDKEKDLSENKNKKHEKYQSKLAEYYNLPVQLPQDEFYQHLTRSKAAEELLQKRFSNSDTEFNGSYGRLCKHKEPEGSNLRRSRSLAVIREETFTDLQIPNHGKNKRSQLIPRARLFDKPCFKDRLPGRAKYQTKEEVLESIYIDSTASCFGSINAVRESDSHTENNESKSDKEGSISRSRKDRSHSRSVSGSWPNLAEDVKQTHLSEDSIGHSRNPSEIDSLDSNYVRKHYNFEAHRKNSYKDSSPETERSVVSPNDSRQLYITTDDLDTESELRDRSKNTTPKSFTNDSLSITQSEKDKPLEETGNEKDYYDEVSLKSKQEEPEELEENKIPKIKFTEPKSDGDQQSLASENDESVSSPESITSYISISIASSTDKSHKLEHLANSLAEKIDEYCEAQFPENNSVSSNTVNPEHNQEVDPIYTKVSKKRTFADIKRDSTLSRSSNIFNEVQKKKNSEVYISNTYIESDDYSTRSSQRHCASSKNITTEPFVTTLIENQYYSLPDINISKCLRKSERIDAQLREEDPEDIHSENTYEIAHSNLREILSSKPGGPYGQLNHQTQVNQTQNQISIQTSNIYFPEYSEPQLIQNFTKLEDDLKSIITIESSNGDDKDLNYYRSETHQNEREINEIENTIRNTKVITKSESLKITNAIYRPQSYLSKSQSNDNINTASQEKKARLGVKKHYSLRQREPTDVIDRLPSPDTVARTLNKSVEVKAPRQHIEDTKTNSLLNRVQSFKTSAESNIALVPLSGHQTIVIDPPLTQDELPINTKKAREERVELIKLQSNPRPCTEIKFQRISSDDKKDRKSLTASVDTSSYCTPKDPFITIKLNKVVKTNLPKLKTPSSEKIAFAQHKFEKPPARLVIKDAGKKNPVVTSTLKTNINMSRPQILQVVDSKSTKQNISSEEKPSKAVSKEIVQASEEIQKKEEVVEQKPECVKEKLNNAIKTDIEYQEKLHSVKNYWSKLIDKTPEKDCLKPDNKMKPDDLNNNNNKDVEENKKVIENEENKYNPEISVGNIVKSIESVKIVDSIRKLSQTKLHLWKDETEKVKSDSEIEETTVQKIVKECEGTIYESSKPKKEKPKIELEPWTRDTPEIEIVELSSEDNANQKTQATLIKAKGFEKGCDEFDHVRYKVMKSELFKNSMIANYRKEAQFDGLLQYLQDYSFQELLVNNNIVIIEPVRTKIEPPRKASSTETCKIPPTMLKRNENALSHVDKSKNAIRRHFFYHPIRVNKEIIEEELPNPDTVKKVRNLFEDTLKMKSPMTHDPPLVEETVGLTRRATSYRNISEDSKIKVGGVRKKIIRQLTIDTNFGNKKWDNASLSSGVSSGDLSSNNEYETDGLSPYSQKNLKETVYSSSDEYLCDSINDFCCESQYVSPDILKKIRDCGTSVTYYGGKVLNSKPGSTVSPMTKAIMDEIKGLQKNCSRDCYSCQTKCRGEKCSCLSSDKHKATITQRQHNSSTSSDSGNQDHDSKRSEGFPGFKFKLVKSNSCSSRLELTGTDDNKSRLKFRKSQKTEDPPLVNDDENSVKNKICRLESYNKGIAKTPFENKEKTVTLKSEVKPIETLRKTVMVAPQPNPSMIAKQKEENKVISHNESHEEHNDASAEKQDPHTFEKKFYYVNENLEQTKAKPAKFGEMVFEEFEVLESCYDSLNSNKSMK